MNTVHSACIQVQQCSISRINFEGIGFQRDLMRHPSKSILEGVPMTISTADEATALTRILPLAEVCKRFRISRSTAYRNFHAGRFPAIHSLMGRAVVLENELEAFIRNLPLAAQRGGK